MENLLPGSDWKRSRKRLSRCSRHILRILLSNLYPLRRCLAYGTPDVNDKNGRKSDRIPLYAIKTYGQEKARLEGDAIKDARQDFDQSTSKVEVKMDHEYQRRERSGRK